MCSLILKSHDKSRVNGFEARVNAFLDSVSRRYAHSLESLLSVKAVDEVDPKRRVTDKNRELLAQGGGNLVSGLLGGLPHGMGGAPLGNLGKNAGLFQAPQMAGPGWSGWWGSNGATWPA